jgi:hypothetical protein
MRSTRRVDQRGHRRVDPGFEQLNVERDPVAGTRTWNGIRFRVTFPGLSEVFIDIGRVVFDGADVVFEAGPHQLIQRTSRVLSGVPG